ncbi:hypothetical protein RYX36_014235, partial [Vicia faba]
DSGRPSFPHCDSKTPIAKCLRNLNDLAHKKQCKEIWYIIMEKLDTFQREQQH